MNNCIGENNRPIFILFLLFQTLQLLFLVIDLVEQAHSGQARNLYIARHPAQALLLGVCALMMLAGTLFLFLVQIYLISINLTTCTDLTIQGNY